MFKYLYMPSTKIYKQKNPHFEPLSKKFKNKFKYLLNDHEYLAVVALGEYELVHVFLSFDLGGTQTDGRFGREALLPTLSLIIL